MQNKVRLTRLIQRLTQFDLSKMTGVSRGALSLIERDLVDPKPSTRKLIADALGRPISDVFPKEEVEPGEK